VLGEDSPSKEGFKLGFWWAQGIALGIDAGLISIQSAVRSMYAAMTTGIAPYMPYVAGGGAGGHGPIPFKDPKTGEWIGLWMGMTDALVNAIKPPLDDVGDEMQDAAKKIQTAGDALIKAFGVPLGGPSDAESYGFDPDYVRTHFPVDLIPTFEGTDAEGFVENMLGEAPDEFFRQVQSVLEGSYDSVDKEDPNWARVKETLAGTLFEVTPEMEDAGKEQLRAFIMVALAAASSGLIPGAFNVDAIVSNLTTDLETEDRVTAVQQALINVVAAELDETAKTRLRAKGIELGNLVGGGFLSARTGVDDFVTHADAKHAELVTTWSETIEFELKGTVSIDGGGGGSSGKSMPKGYWGGPAEGYEVPYYQHGGTLKTTGAGSGDFIPFSAMLAPREVITVTPRADVKHLGAPASRQVTINIGNINNAMDVAMLEHIAVKAVNSSLAG